MLVIPELLSADDLDDCRTHPWGKTTYAEDGGAYYDFKVSPELIPHVLEDFIPFAHYATVQRFYAFLEWVNVSPESTLETNDCAMRPPSAHEDALFRWPLKLGGRVEIFHCDYTYNIDSIRHYWLKRMFYIYLQVYRPDLRNVLISIAAINTIYNALPAEQSCGKRLRLTCNIYGDSEAGIFDTLWVVFNGFWEASKRISKAVKSPAIDPM